MKFDMVSSVKKFGRRSDKALWVAKRVSLVAGFATAAAWAGKYGSKLLVRLLTRR